MEGFHYAILILGLAVSGKYRPSSFWLYSRTLNTWLTVFRFNAILCFTSFLASAIKCWYGNVGSEEVKDCGEGFDLCRNGTAANDPYGPVERFICYSKVKAIKYSKINETNGCNDNVRLKHKGKILKYKYCVCDKDLCNKTNGASSLSIMQILTMVATSYFAKTVLN